MLAHLRLNLTLDFLFVQKDWKNACHFLHLSHFASQIEVADFSKHCKRFFMREETLR